MTWYLADYGADVIWIEPPGGDPSREEYAVRYSVYNRNKRSMVLDLKDPAGREELLALLETADVFVQGWRPGVAERLGLGYDEVHARVPGLVYCSISGFGPGRPDSDLPGYEELVHAASGAMGAQPGHREPPIFLGLPVASAGAAYMGLTGVLAALYRREEDGYGRHVETSLLDGIIAYLAQGWGYSERMLSGPPMSLGGARFVARTFRCGDDEWLGVCTFGRGAFDRFIKAMGLDDKVAPSEPGADIMVPLTPEESQVINLGLPDTFATQPRKVWMERLLEADIAAIPVLRQGEVFDEPQPVHNHMVVEVDDPALGRVQQVAPAIRFGTTPATAPGPAPTVDQHGAQIRAEIQSAGRPAVSKAGGAPDERPLLEGVRLLDLGHWFAAPFSGRLLADFGAEVIKLEPPLGDGMRGFERAFAAAAAGKRSVAADIKHPELVTLRERLVDWADVVMHNLRPGVAERLGLGYDDLRARKADIIYFNAPGWGSSGPDTLRQSFAPLMSGYCGAAFEIAGQFNAPIGPMTNEDTGAGMLGAVALLIALLHRKRTGTGQAFELPQLNSAMTDMAHIVRRSDGTVLGADTLDPLQTGTSPLRRLYQTSDGWVCIVATSDDHLRGLGTVLGVDLLADERFSSAELRTQNAYLLEHLLMERFAEHTASDLVAELQSAGVPAVVPALNANIPTMDDPLNERLGRVAELQHPRYGRVREPAVMLRVNATDIPPHRRAPELGEQTEEILAWAGYDAETVAALRAERVVV
jgi:crotonobetainyl-CoA:carnitine CoA-transferase CaiB-like acyl-CoA transferase